MFSNRSFFFAVLPAVFLLAATSAPAQSIVSAKSGAIHHVEGEALIDGKVLEPRKTEFPNLKEGSVLRTKLGRVEMLLTPGVIVRLGEESAIRMVTNQLDDTRLEMVEGSALVEAMEILKENSVCFLLKDAEIQLLAEGLYRIDADSTQLRVYDGKAQVKSGEQTLVAKKGRLVELDGPALAATKFDSKTGDSLHRWSYRRSGYLSMANLSAAKSISDWGTPWYSRGGWYWNPYFGMFTFVPASGIFHSPFGFSYWSPSRIHYAYYNPPPQSPWGSGSGGGRGFNSDLGYVTVGRGASGGSISSGSAGAAPAAAPSVSRGGGGGASRGDGGGGRSR
jgi:hypothetical protein